MKDFFGEKSDDMYELVGIERKAPKRPSNFDFRPVGYGTQDWEKIIGAAEKAGTEWLVVEQDQPSMGLTPMECAKKSLKYLAEVAREYGSVILVEDLPRTCLGRNSDDMLELLSADPDLRACFDTNHLLDEDIAKFIHAIGDKIASTHISDYDFNNERHWLPGEGDIDWQQLISALKEVGYKGVWLYEIDLKCPWTITRDRDLTCKDFADNLRELSLNNVPKPLGIRVDGLKHWTK